MYTTIIIFWRLYLMNKFIKCVALTTSILLLGSMFMGCESEYSNKDSDSAESTPAVVTTVSKNQGEEVSGNMGEEISNENIAINLKNVYKLNVKNPEEGYTYIAFYVEVVNNSQEDHYFNSISSFNISVDNEKINEDLLTPSSAMLYIKQHTNFYQIKGDVAPGTMLDGLVTAKVPSNFSSATLYFYPNITTSTGVTEITITPDVLEDCPTTD